jgi:hypothetical protein
MFLPVARSWKYQSVSYTSRDVSYMTESRLPAER